MRLLLDTHALMWWWANDARLTDRVKQAVSNDDAAIFVSAASAWEIATKDRIGKLRSVVPIERIEEAVIEEGFSHLPLTMRHGICAGSYAAAHSDPFDRMLAAQAQIEDLTLVTLDPAFAVFPCRTLW